jgi:ABC-type nitrate/sulfonate/bicarbonate transport system permease component
MGEGEMKMSRLKNSTMNSQVAWIKILTVLIALGSWELLARSGLFFEGVIPPVFTILVALVKEIINSGFYRDLGITLLEASVGFIAGSVIGIGLGLLLGVNSFLRRMIEPYILALGGTPKIVFLPILFLIFGLGLESKMAKAALSAFFPVVLNTTSGFIEIPHILLRVGQSFHLRPLQMIQKIYIPAMTKPLLTGLRLGMGMAIIGVLSAEITYSNGGLGYRLIRNADQFQIPAVYALAILIFAVATAINFCLTKVENHFGRNKRGGGKNEGFIAELSRR